MMFTRHSTVVDVNISSKSNVILPTTNLADKTFEGIAPERPEKFAGIPSYNRNIPTDGEDDDEPGSIVFSKV